MASSVESQAEQPTEYDPQNNGDWTEFKNFWGHDPRDSNFQLIPTPVPDNQRNERQAHANFARSFEVNVLKPFLLGLQRLTIEAGVPVLDTKLIEAVITDMPRRDLHAELDLVEDSRDRAIYYGDLVRDRLELDHFPCSACEDLEIEIARDFVNLSPEEWLSKVEWAFDLRFQNPDAVGDARIFHLHSVYRMMSCSGRADDAKDCRRFDYVQQEHYCNY